MFLLGVQKPYLNIYTPFSPKTAILGTEFDGTYKFSAENSFNIRDAKSTCP